MRGRTIEWEDAKQQSLVQRIVDASRKISMNAAGRGNSGIIFSPYVASIFAEQVDVSSEEYKKQQKERHQQEIRKAAEEWE